MNLHNKHSLKDDLYNSQFYRHIGDNGRRIVNDVVNTVEDVASDINNEFNNPPPPPPSQNYRRPPQANQNYNQAKNYPPPKSYSAPKPVKPTKPEKPEKKKTEYRFNALRWLMIISGFLVPLNYNPFHPNSILIPIFASACGIGTIYLANWIFKVREKKKPAPHEEVFKTVREEKTEASTGNKELDKIINEGKEYIRKLKIANDAIPHEQLSESIERMENASFDIFTYVKDNPSKIPQIKKFMNYYLPTTLKLLENYEKLSNQSVKGENILNTMHEIECMMYTVATAFEKQLDALFSQQAMDIGVDISVFDSILKQEGLKDDEKMKI